MTGKTLGLLLSSDFTSLKLPPNLPAPHQLRQQPVVPPLMPHAAGDHRRMHAGFPGPDRKPLANSCRLTFRQLSRTLCSNLLSSTSLFAKQGLDL